MDSANRHGILLEVVQALTDLELTITKAYISSDGGWFMDGKCPLHLTHCTIVLSVHTANVTQVNMKTEDICLVILGFSNQKCFQLQCFM